MERLRELVGRERSVREVSQTLHFFASNFAATAVGAMHVTCADESEQECVEAFQHGFVQYLLPQLKFARQSPFRLANLGGRYEWGAVRIAEAHYATPASATGFKLLVVKINSHVAVEEVPGDGVPVGDAKPLRLGIWRRYDLDSTCCGALHSLLSGNRDPWTEDLRELLLSEGRDRIAELLDESAVDPAYRPLYAALVSSRLQARKAVLDIQDYAPLTPTFFLVVPCVTLNKHGRDTEIICGLYTVDGRAGGRDATYFGLGDDPAAYRVEVHNRLFSVSDEHVGTERKGRDHRALALQEWRHYSEGKPFAVRDERLERLRQDVAADKHRDHHHAKKLLRIALPLFAEVAPIPAAVLMFADGVAGIHHAFKIHQLTREMSDAQDAREILDEIHGKVDQLEPDRAEALIELLLREYRA